MSRVSPESVSPIQQSEARSPRATDLALAQVDLERIFANFAEILTLSKLLLKALQGAFAEVGVVKGHDLEHASLAPSELQLGRTLLPLLPFLKQYSLFLASFATGVQLLNQLETNSAVQSGSRANGTLSQPQQQAWQMFVANVRQKAHHKPRQASALHLNLSGLLLNIVQRLPRYRLLLAELVRLADSETADAADLQTAYNLVDKGKLAFGQVLCRH